MWVGLCTQSRAVSANPHPGAYSHSLVWLQPRWHHTSSPESRSVLILFCTEVWSWLQDNWRDSWSMYFVSSQFISFIYIEFFTAINVSQITLLKPLIHPFTHTFINQWVNAAMQGAVSPTGKKCRVKCLAQGQNYRLGGYGIWKANLLGY